MVNLKFGAKWKRTISLPAKGRFVAESHYSTTSDKFGERLFPKTTVEGIDAHLERSLAVLKSIKPAVTKGEVYNNSWEKCWTPPENGKAGQASRGDQKPSVEQECWQGNMMFAPGTLPKPGTRFLVEANGKACVIQMGFEVGPGQEKFLGGLVPEVHWYLGTSSDSIIELSYLEDQSVKLGPVVGEIKSEPKEEAMSAEPKWLAIARGELGVHEKPGAPNEPRILEYIKACPGMPLDDEDCAWCSCFINWVFMKLGMTRTKDARAKSWLKWGEKLSHPKPGCVVVFWRGTPTAATGHVSLYVSGHGTGTIKCLGGNQSNKVCVANYDESRVLGYFWPKEA